MAFSNPQNVSATLGTAGATSASLTIAKPAAGQLLIACFAYTGTTTDPGANLPTDNGSGGWQQFGTTAQAGSPTSTTWIAVFYKITNATDAASLTTVSFSWTNTGATTLTRFYVDEFDGFTGTPTLDLTGAGNGSGATAAFTQSSATGAAATELAVSYLILGNTSGGLNAAACYFTPDTAATKYQFTTFADSSTRLYMGWSTPTTSGSGNRWQWTWTTTRLYEIFGLTFYDAVVASGAASPAAQASVSVGGSVTRFGAAGPAAQVSVSASGIVTELGTAAPAPHASVSSSATLTEFGATAASTTAAVTAGGIPTVLAQASPAPAFAVTVSAAGTTTGSSAPSAVASVTDAPTIGAGVSVASVAQVSAAGVAVVLGSARPTVTATSGTTGVVTRLAAAGTTLVAGVAASGSLARLGAASLSASVGVVSAGRVTALGTATTATAASVASGGTVGVLAFGQAAALVTVSPSGTGTALGSATADAVVSVTVEVLAHPALVLTTTARVTSVTSSARVTSVASRQRTLAIATTQREGP